MDENKANELKNRQILEICAVEMFRKIQKNKVTGQEGHNDEPLKGK